MAIAAGSREPVRRAGSRPGFTLLQLLLVAALIALIAAFTLPSILGSKIAANEAAAMANLKGFVIAQEQYRMTFGRYAVSLGELRDAQLVDEKLGRNELVATGENPYPANCAAVMQSGSYMSNNPNYDPTDSYSEWYQSPPDRSGEYLRGSKTGYFYLLLGRRQVYGSKPVGWCAVAWPVAQDKTGKRSFYVDGSGAIRYRMDPSAEGGPLDKSAPLVEP